MKTKDAKEKICTWNEARQRVQARQAGGGRVVFTNGCFDLLHVGHLRYLAQARAWGDFLIIGLNSDRSVETIKGPPRPIIPQDQRTEILAGLTLVDAVVIFDQPDPLELITFLQPDLLVKGGDWSVEKIIGREVVEARGGRALTVPLTPGISTTAILERIRTGKPIKNG
ncbi:MAG: D-glycero-beta-D-manno-heptose 1-phosphate adenylyltransferase [Pseudomonadota bacterium]